MAEREDYNGKVTGAQMDAAIISMGAAEDFSESLSYSKGSFVMHSDKMYRANQDMSAGTWDSNKWDETTVNKEVQGYGTTIATMGTAPDFEVKSASSPYHKDDLVTYGGRMYRCTATEFSGAWNAASWTETTAVNEIRDLRGTSVGYETVTIQASVNKGSGSVAGLVFTVRFAAGSVGTTQTVTLNSAGKATLSVAIGDKFRVEPAALSGYIGLNTGYYEAVLTARQVNVKYIYMDDDIYILTTDRELIPYTEWDTDDNDKAAFVVCQSSTLGSTGIVMFPKTVNVTSATFQPEYVDCSMVTNRGNATAANADMTGKSQADAWVTWAETPDSEGETPVQKYNRVYSKSLTLDQYLPAIRGCYNKTVTFDGQTLHGYLPSMGQLMYICDNKTQLAYVMTLIGSSLPAIDSGHWWSCSEYDIYYCWSLYSGSTDYNGKNTSYQLFALYDLSEINL